MELTDQQFEYDAIHSGAGICVLDNRLFVRITGDDRIAFMHGMCSADVKNLLPGNVSRGLVLTEHAHVIAELFLYALEEALLLEIERQRWPAVREYLERFLVADDVELEELDRLAVLDIEGPASMVVARYFDDRASVLRQWHHLECDGIRIASLARNGAPAFSIIGDETALASTAERIKLQHKLRELHPETLEILRIENGLPLVGTDTNARTLAIEARLEHAIAFNKGCYVGQETIERATAHGSLKRRLCGLRIAGNEMPEPGSVISLDGREVGRLTSVARSPLAGVIGMAILHHSAWAAGTSVSIVRANGALNASVSELPFLPPASAALNELRT